VVGRRDRGHVGHRGVRHGLLRGSTCLEFSKYRYRSPFGNKTQTVYMQTQLFPRCCARCGFEPTRLSTRRRCTRHQCRLAASSLSLRSHAAPVSPPRPWPLTRTGRSTPASRARCQPTEAQATGKSPRAEHPVMPGVSSVHPEVRRLLPHWQAFSIDERQVRARHTPNGNAPQLCLLPRI
jgi:hypothetical protein